jgi:hypothetical protein
MWMRDTELDPTCAIIVSTPLCMRVTKELFDRFAAGGTGTGSASLEPECLPGRSTYGVELRLQPRVF